MDNWSAKIYEEEAVRSLFGETLNPGGFALITRAVNYCGFQPGTKLLDIGCGLGSTVQYLRTNFALDVLGIDVSAKLISLGLENYPALPIYTAQAEKIPYPEASFQGVISECVMPYFENVEVVLKEIYRVLEPNGRLILSNLYFYKKEPEPTKPNIWPGKPENILFKQEVFSLLEKYGFVVQLWEDHSHLLSQFLCDIIMKGGSPPKMQLACPAGVKLGYYLLVAEKR